MDDYMGLPKEGNIPKISISFRSKWEVTIIAAARQKIDYSNKANFDLPINEMSLQNCTHIIRKSLYGASSSACPLNHKAQTSFQEASAK